MKTKSFAHTDIGRVREENQDDYLIDEEMFLYIVADGMGGMRDGKEAARYAVKAVSKFVRDNLSGWKGDPAEMLNRAINAARDSFLEALGYGSGSTVVAVMLTKDKAAVANLGDSPAFLLRKGELSLLTMEHNVANILVKAGRLAPEEVKDHPGRHQLTAFLGIKDRLPAHLSEFEPADGDRLLLCTDGLTGMVPTNSIASLLKTESELSRAARDLVKLANEAGGHDNTTVLLVDIISVRDDHNNEN